MNPTQPFQQLSQCLAGVFQNRDQALANPTWFVHIRIWIHPVPLFEADSATFFIEQASAAFAQAPYRQRVLRVRPLDGDLTAEYYALKDPQAFQGATQDLAQLQTLTADHLLPLTGSRLQVTAKSEPEATRFEARQYAGERCQFTVNNEVKCVELAFDAIAPLSNQTSAAFWMYDKGVDPTTGKATWGATNGPFQLIKVEDWSARLPRAVIS